MKIAHENGVKVYVAMNAMFHNDKVEELTDYVSFLNEVNVDAIVFGDPAVLMAVRSSTKYAVALEYRNDSNKLVHL